MSGGRASMPDVDVDFCMEGRDAVIQYVMEKYGKGECGPDHHLRKDAGEGGRFAMWAACIGIPYAEVDRIAKLIPNMLNITLEQALKQEPGSRS